LAENGDQNFSGNGFLLTFLCKRFSNISITAVPGGPLMLLTNLNEDRGRKKKERKDRKKRNKVCIKRIKGRKEKVTKYISKKEEKKRKRSNKVAKRKEKEEREVTK
jgi:hypothetical protein